LDSAANRLLWFREIETGPSTSVTPLWDAYVSTNYQSSGEDFFKAYQGRDSIDLAIQIGPNNYLWAYHHFILRPFNDCWILSRSYFQHARFTYKAYAVLNGAQVNALLAAIPHYESMHPMKM
jgi:hypothetical protein